MEKTAQLIIDTLKEAGTTMGQPAFEAAVAYTLAWATVGFYASVAILVIGAFLFAVFFLVEFLSPTSDGGLLFIGLLILTFTGIVGSIGVTSTLAVSMEPEGYLVMEMVNAFTGRK